MSRLNKIVLFFALFLSGCTGEYSQYWYYSSFKPCEHKVELDSAYAAKYGGVDTLHFMNNFPDKFSVNDSIPYFFVSFEKKYHESFFLLFSIIHQRKREKYGFEISIDNSKSQIRSLDSIYYTMVDSTTPESITGKFIFGKDLFLDKERHPLWYLTTNSIDMHPKKGDVIKATVKLYCTDIFNNVKVISDKKVRFIYYRNWGYWYTVFS